MKKFLTSILLIAALAFTPASAMAQLTVPQGGTGLTSASPNYFIMGSSTLRFHAVSTTTAASLFTGFATTTYPAFGSGGFVQFASSTANHFTATSSFVYRILGNLLGVNKTTPLAHIHAGTTATTTPTPTGLDFTTYFGANSGNGYSFGSGNKNYSAYQRVGAIYSSAQTGTYTELTAADGNLGGCSVTPNYSGSGYTPTGTQIDFEVYAYFADGTISPSPATCNFTDNGTDPYSVTVGFSIGLGNANGILLVRNATDYLTVPNNTSGYEDTNSGWGSLPHGLSTVSKYYIVPSVTDQTIQANLYVFRNTTTSKFKTVVPPLILDPDDTTWTAGSPTVTPTSGPDSSFTSDGTTRLADTTNSSLAFFGAKPVPFQSSADLVTGLSNYGLFNSAATLAASKLSGTIPTVNGGTGSTGFASSRIPFSNGSILTSDSSFVILDGAVAGSRRLGVGVSSPAAIGHFVGTGYPCGRFGYNTSNYFNISCGSTGLITLDAVGATSSIVFSDNVSVGSTTAPSTFSVKGSAANNLFNLASSTGATLFNVNQGGHVVTGGGTPTVSTCGTSPSISGNDTAGTVTVGSGVVVACTITFARTRTNTPRVVGVVTGGGLNIAGGYSAKSTSAVTFSFAATVGSGTFDYLIIE